MCIRDSIVNFRSKYFKQPYGDQGLIIHRTTYFKNNGFRKIPLMEDVDFLRRLNNKKDLKELKNIGISKVTLFADAEVVSFYKRPGWILEPRGSKCAFWYAN